MCNRRGHVTSIIGKRKKQNTKITKKKKEVRIDFARYIAMGAYVYLYIYRNAQRNFVLKQSRHES